jgi:uncharacterized protein YndB with AHSA1/START domain
VETSPLPFVSVTRRFDVPPAQVFDAWLRPETAGIWLFSTPTSRMVRIEIDPKAGGVFNFTDRRDGVDVVHTGEYLEIDPPHRLAFTLRVGDLFPQTDLVRIEIKPLEPGCELTLTQTVRPEWAEMKGKIEAGWGAVLGRLAGTLE